MKKYCYNQSANSEEKEDCKNPNEKLLNDNHENLNCNALTQTGFDCKAIDEKLEIEPNALTIIQALGNGYFSDVHMGMLSLPTGNVPVAVKRPQMETGAMNAAESAAILKRQIQALKDELSIFAHLQSSSTGGHENVLKLLGAITTIRTEFSLLTEYCECGSMDRFLQAKWRNGAFEDELVIKGSENEQVWKIQRDSKWGEDFRSRRENGLITTSDLLWFALQIARGMQFLATMNVMHRDIAVRNVLLKLDFTLKVADFGLSRKLMENDDAYYVGKEGTALPIRYIAPESLKSGRFSITSEYWSFGVVVWELFTFAEQQPYSVEFDKYENNVHFFDFLREHLSSGHRLLIPNNIPQQMKILLSRLWLSDPKRRPSFEVCRKVIRQELMQSCPNILSNEKASHHASEHSLFRFDDKDINEDTSNPIDYKQIASSTSKLSSSDIQQTENNETRVRKKVKRRIIVCVGLLAVLLLAVGIVIVVFTLLYTPLFEKKNVASSPNSTITEVPPIINSTNPLVLHKTPNKYRKAAEQGDAEAQFQLGLMYRDGKDVPQSDEETVKWYRKSAEQGYANAQQELGRIYENGQGVNQSNEEAVKWYRKSAEQENANAQFNLGVMYQNGLSVNKSYDEALKWYRKAAGQGLAKAQNNIGNMYYYGQSVPQSDGKAVKWYIKAAEQGDADAQFNLGWMYKYGRGLRRSNEQAIIWYRKAAEQGNILAKFYLAHMYKHYEGVPQSNAEAAKWFREVAEQGDVIAQYNLGEMYRNGRGVPRSDEEAVKWYREAAERGDADAQLNYGMMCYFGRGVNQSFEDAVIWFKKAVKHGFPLSQSNLGTNFKYGNGFNQSDEEAVKWYINGADQGDAVVQFNLGDIHRNGRGVNQSDEEALKWYRKAADQGLAKAQNNIGNMYYYGQSVPQSDEEAVKWYRKAAEQGDADAQFNIGWMCHFGRGISQSSEEALRWYRKAAEQGNMIAQFYLASIYKLSEGILQSDEEAAQWYRKAAEQGDANAQYNLGVMYMNGQGVLQSDGEAVKWYTESAEQGIIKAQYNLGDMYRNGNGIPQSDEEAEKWYRKAGEQGYGPAKVAQGLILWEKYANAQRSSEQLV